MCKQCIKSIRSMFERGITDSMYSGNQISFKLDQVGKCPAMKALEELTPGGSEFYEDPIRCAAMIKESRVSTHRFLIKTVTDRNDLLVICNLLPLHAFDEDMDKVDAAQFVDNANAFFETMTAYKKYKKGKS